MIGDAPGRLQESLESLVLHELDIPEVGKALAPDRIARGVDADRERDTREVGNRVPVLGARQPPDGHTAGLAGVLRFVGLEGIPDPGRGRLALGIGRVRVRIERRHLPRPQHLGDLLPFLPVGVRGFSPASLRRSNAAHPASCLVMVISPPVLLFPPMQTIVVTGAGSGVGRGVALRFAADGWNVALVGRSVEALVETSALSGDAARERIVPFPCDVGDADAVAAMGGAVLARFGEVDVLVNSAGTNVVRRSLATLATEDWHRVLATNLHGAYYCVQAFLPGMRARRTGTIVNINSDAGQTARDLSGAAYVASKFGLRGLTQQINAEERGNGVRACSICPRDVNTPLLDRRPEPPPAEVRARMIQPADLAECVWLAATLPLRVVLDEITLSTR